MITGGEDKKETKVTDPAATGGGQPTTTESGSKMGEINVEKSNNIVNIGKDLISKGFSVAEHPDFTKTPTASGGSYTPGEGSVSDVHSGRGHYEGRASMSQTGEELLKIQRQDIAASWIQFIMMETWEINFSSTTVGA